MFEDFEVKNYGKTRIIKSKTRNIGRKKGVWSKYEWVLMLGNFPVTLPKTEIKLDEKENGIEFMCDENGVFLANVCDDIDSLNSNITGVMVLNDMVEIILDTVVVKLDKSQISEEFLSDLYYVQNPISEESSSLLTRKRKADIQKLEDITKSLRKNRNEDCDSQSQKSISSKSVLHSISALSVLRPDDVNTSSTGKDLDGSISSMEDTIPISIEHLQTIDEQTPTLPKQSSLDKNLVQRIRIDNLKKSMYRLQTTIYSLKFQQINSDRLEFKKMYSDLDLEYFKNLTEQGENLEQGDPIIVTEKRKNEKDCYEVINGVKRAQILSKGIHRMVNVAVIPEAHKDVYVLKKKLFLKSENYFFNKEKAEVVKLLLRYMEVSHGEAIQWKPIVVFEVFQGTFITSQIIKLSVDPHLAPLIENLIGIGNLSKRDGEKLCSVYNKNSNGVISLMKKGIEEKKSFGQIMEGVGKIRPDFLRTLKAKGYLSKTSSVFLKENENHPKMEKFIDDLHYQSPRNTKLITLMNKWENFLLNDTDDPQCVVCCEISLDFEVAIGSNVNEDTWKSAQENDKLVICFSREPVYNSAFFTLLFDKKLIGKKDKGMFQNSVCIYVAKFVNSTCLPQEEFAEYCANYDFELSSVISMTDFSHFLGKIGKAYITDDLINKEISMAVVSCCSLVSTSSRNLALYISEQKKVEMTENISSNKLYHPDAFQPDNLL